MSLLVVLEAATTPPVIASSPPARATVGTAVVPTMVVPVRTEVKPEPLVPPVVATVPPVVAVVDVPPVVPVWATVTLLDGVVG